MSKINENWNKKERVFTFDDCLHWRLNMSMRKGRFAADIYTWFHWILHLLTLAIIIFVIVQFSSTQPGNDFIQRFDKRLSDINAETFTKSREKVYAVVFEPFDNLQNILKEKRIFQLPWEAPINETIDLNTSMELSQQLRLVGVYLDGDSQAIIEDQSTRETYFISVGERIGNAQLYQIEEGKAIFIYNGEKVELTL